MSTHIRIFEYYNKMGLEYYLYLCNFPTTNIFGYSFVDFWTTKYIWIYARKFLKIQIILNIFSESYFSICLFIFDEKSKSLYNLCIKNPVKNSIFRKHEWAFKKKFFNHWWVRIFEYLNNDPQKLFVFDSCYFWNTNIFGDLFGKFLASEYIQIFIWYRVCGLVV